MQLGSLLDPLIKHLLAALEGGLELLEVMGRLAYVTVKMCHGQTCIYDCDCEDVHEASQMHLLCEHAQKLCYGPLLDTKVFD